MFNWKDGIGMNRLLRPLLIVSLVSLLAWMFIGCGGSSLTGTSDTQATSVPLGATTEDASKTAGLQPVLIGFKATAGSAEAGLVSKAAGKIKYSYHFIPVVAASLSAQAITALSHDPRVAYIEPDATVTATADSVPWGISKVKADLVWPSGNTGSGVKVAIIDTGIDRNHPDLAPNYKGGYDFVNKDSDPMDDNGHGTHVSGTVAAAADGANVKGVGPNISLYALKVLNKNGLGSYSDIIAAIQWAVSNGMQVVSMSFGGSTRSTALQSACDAAYNANVLLVAAAGNSGKSNGKGDTVDYPAVYSSVIAVAASDSNNVRASWSSTGTKVELTAPGVNVTSDKLGGGLIAYSGTSMATPHVSGCAALLIASGVTGAANVRTRLDSTATDLGAAGRDALYGFGLVNVQKAINPTLIAAR